MVGRIGWASEYIALAHKTASGPVEEALALASGLEEVLVVVYPEAEESCLPKDQLAV
jgi:hypothetical protein